jgi:hypothetical protein
MVRLDPEGRVVEHSDYWDAAEQLYGRLPLSGVVLRAIRRRLQLAPSRAVAEAPGPAITKESAPR